MTIIGESSFLRVTVLEIGRNEGKLNSSSPPPSRSLPRSSPRSNCRIPISPDRPIEDNYLDAYLAVLKGIDPLKTSVLISCGMGVVRTTFAMTAAVLVRRHQLLRLDLPDPFATVLPHSAPTSPKLAPAKLSRSNTPTSASLLLSISMGTAPASGTASGYSTVSFVPSHGSKVTRTNGNSFVASQPGGQTAQAERIIEVATQQHALNRSLLKLTHMLDKGTHLDLSFRTLHLQSRPIFLFRFQPSRRKGTRPRLPSSRLDQSSSNLFAQLTWETTRSFSRFSVV